MSARFCGAIPERDQCPPHPTVRGLDAALFELEHVKQSVARLEKHAVSADGRRLGNRAFSFARLRRTEGGFGHPRLPGSLPLATPPPAVPAASPPPEGWSATCSTEVAQKNSCATGPREGAAGSLRGVLGEVHQILTGPRKLPPMRALQYSHPRRLRQKAVVFYDYDLGAYRNGKQTSGTKQLFKPNLVVDR